MDTPNGRFNNSKKQMATRSNDPRTLLRFLLGTLSMAVLVSSSALAEDISVRVRARYPTRGELQQQVEHVKAADLVAYEATRRDFDEAIWQRRILAGPPRPGPPILRPVKLPGPTLTALWTRSEWERYISDTEALEGGAALAQFYRDHIDDFTIDDSSPVLREVLINVVLNGWHDWTHWDHEKLINLREKFPELHRVYAIRELRRLKIEDIGGVLFDEFMRPDIAQELVFPLFEGVKDLVKPEDAFELVLDTYLQSNDPVIRTRMEGHLPGFSARAGKSDRVKQVWRPFLESEVPLLRFEARKAFNLPVPDIFASHDIHERWVAENDADPGRREKAREHVENRELQKSIRQRQGQQAP